MTREISTEFAIVGSGAAGSVLAYHLSRARFGVVLVERGKRMPPAALNHDETTMIGSLYKDGGAQLNSDLDMFLLQGNCVGGTTLLTNGVCFRMPEHVRRRWANQGFEMPASALDESQSRVESVLNVAELPDHLCNPAAAKIRNAMVGLGLQPGRFKKNYLDCIGCGFCNIGCRYGRKLDASMTWVPMAESHGCTLLDQTEVSRIESSRGRVTALQCRDLRDGSRLRIRAKRIILSGGAINSPELLLRSGIQRSVAGLGASFNAGAIVFAEFPEPIDADRGDQMGVYYQGPGFVMEQIHNPPLSFALTLPGAPSTHTARMRRARQLTSAGVLVPTDPVGRVYLGLGNKILRPFFDHAEVEFRIPESNLAALREGLKTTARIFLAAGASAALIPTHEPIIVRAERDLESVDRYITSQKDIANFGSSHPQGGASVGDDPRRNVCGPDFRVRGMDNLFVCDASSFPDSVEVNPQIAIMSMADMAVRSIGGFSPPAAIEEGPAYEARIQRFASGVAAS